MTKNFIRLPNGNKLDYYNYALTNALIVKFKDKKIDEVNTFFGTEIIDYVDILNENGDLVETHNIYMKRKTIATETITVTEYEDRIVKEAWTEEKEVLNEETGETSTVTIENPAIIEKIPKDVSVDLITVILEKPTVSEEIDNMKDVIGIVNTNTMTLDEFRSYYKTQLGKVCTSAIESGADVETSKGVQHFSYTMEDQSNLKDLIIIRLITDLLKIKLGIDIEITLPYHADGHLCDIYTADDILKIYMALSSNKTYHTTYCNLLNAMLNDAKDMETIKSITYGMEITDKDYLNVITKVNNSKDALLELVEKAISDNDNKDEDNKEKENVSNE